MIPLLSKNLNRLNFTIFDARSMASDISNLILPLIPEDETRTEMSFLEVLARMPEKVFPQSEMKRKAPEPEEEPSPKKQKVEFDTTAVTHRVLEILHSRSIVHVHELSSILQIKDSRIRQIVDVLAVVGSAVVNDDGFVAPRTVTPLSVSQPLPPSQSEQPRMSSDCDFGFPFTPQLDYDTDFANSQNVVLPFSRPSALLPLISPQQSHTSTVSSSSSSVECEHANAKNNKNSDSCSTCNPLSYISYSSLDSDCGWADSIWSH